MRHRRTPLRLAAALLVFLLLFPAAQPARAIIPVTDAAHILTNLIYHIIHYLQFAQQIVNQYEQIRNQVEQIRHGVQSLKKLDVRNWREVYDLIAYMDYLMRQGQALAYSLDNVLATYTPPSRATSPGRPTPRRASSRAAAPSILSAIPSARSTRSTSTTSTTSSSWSASRPRSTPPRAPSRRWRP
jgi:conjugal transfer/entry exclusion protein